MKFRVVLIICIAIYLLKQYDLQHKLISDFMLIFIVFIDKIFVKDTLKNAWGGIEVNSFLFFDNFSY